MFVTFASSLTEEKRLASALEPQSYVTRPIDTSGAAAALLDELNGKRSDYAVEAGQRVAPTARVDETLRDDEPSPSSVDGSGELVLPHLKRDDKTRPVEDAGMNSGEAILAYLSDLTTAAASTGGEALAILEATRVHHSGLYKQFIEGRDDRVATLRSNGLGTAAQSFKVFFALGETTTSRQMIAYRKQLASSLDALVTCLGLIPTATPRDIYTRLDDLVRVRWPAALRAKVTMAAYIDFEKQTIEKPDKSLTVDGGDVDAVRTVLDNLAEIGAALRAQLAQQLSSYRLSLQALELANDRVYYAASAASDVLDTALIRIWGGLFSSWHEWLALWALMTVRSNNAALKTVASIDEAKLLFGAHKQRLSNVARVMTTTTITGSPSASLLTVDGVFAVVFANEVLFPNQITRIAPLSDDQIATTVLFYPRVVQAWRETTQAYRNAKALLTQQLTGDSVPLLHVQHGMATLRSVVRPLWRLVHAWTTEVRDLSPISLADLVVLSEIEPKLSGATTEAASKKRAHSCLRYDSMARFWSAWLGTSLPTFDTRRVATLSASLATIYGYAKQDMYEHVQQPPPPQ